MEINHFSHPHPLVILDPKANDESEKVDCSGCGEAIEGSIYGCGSCKFFLHKKCVDLPREINHRLHTQHPLILYDKSPYSPYGFLCNVCHSERGFAYHCTSCKFDLDIRCATSSQFSIENLQELQHFSHDHSLIFVQHISFESKYKKCSGCMDSMSSPFYCCPNCGFYLHKACAELPLEINHPRHQKHLLTLQAKPPAHQQGCSCYICKESWTGFFYYCFVCKFGLTVPECFDVLLQKEVMVEIHDHPLRLFLKTLSFICDACGVSGDQSWFPYTCSECNVMIHKKCVSLRRTIKITRHAHLLSHTCFFPDKEARSENCGICYDVVDLTYGSYSCMDCSYFVHVKCATAKDLLEEEYVMLEKDQAPHQCVPILAHTALGLTQPAAVERPKISFAAKEIDVREWKGDVLVVGVTEKDLVKDGKSRFENSVLNKLDAQLGGLLAEASSEEDFTGKAGQSVVLRVRDFGSKRVGLIGLGQSSSSTTAFRSFGEGIAAAAKSAQAKSAAVVLAFEAESKLDSASAIASGIIQGIYEDVRYKSETKKPLLKSVDVLGFGTGAELEKRFQYAEAVSSAIILGKELVNSPANVLTPAALAAEASNIASQYSDVISAKILTEEQCKELKMGSYLAVAAASANPPHFIHLCYKPSNGVVETKLALVGKGLTFDSGGYNIKTGPGCLIELMKFDMGGSAAVLGAAKAIGQIKPAGVEVHFIVAACENMISGTGMRPGDIVTASNGKTIEVNNTDAEGRLTLADALVYACNQGVDKIIDLATLTGACIIALGPSISGVFTPSDDLAKEVLQVSEITGEKFWRMPMEESYWETMKSGVADMVNTGVRQGGAITASLFLKQFVDEKVQWMHIDLAGPVWNDKKKSATGFGISTLVEWVLKNSS